MNPKYHLLIAVAALSLNACSTDDTCTEPEIGGYKISFTVAEDTETRTTLEMLEAGNFLRWVSTDKVGIYTVGQSVNSNIETTADVSKSPVEFVGTLEQQASSGDMFYAYYPYNAEQQSTDPATVKLSIPAEQSQTKAGVYNGESHPLVAVPMKFSQEWGNAGRMSSVRFRQLGAIVELQLYSSNEALRSESICSVTFGSETPLAGDFSLNLKNVTVNNELPISGYASKMVTTLLEAPAAIPATKDEAARVYLTIAPGQYTGEIVVKTNVAKYAFRLKNTMDFKRAAIKGLPADLAKVERIVLSPDELVTVNYPIRFEDSTVEEICLANWDANNNGELSYKEAAEITSIGTKFEGTSIRSFNELQYFTGLQSIENSAFSGCSSLTSINIPNGVTSIGSQAFESCSSLTSINIPERVTEIKYNTFQNCSSLKSIHIPDGVTSIGNNAFRECSNLTGINIPDGVTSIGVFAFYNCCSLTSIHLPNGVTEIGECAFGGCSSLTSINIPDGVTSIGSRAFENCSSLMRISIPEGVTAIEDETFMGCSSLTSIDIPPTVSSIGESVFAGCTSLSAFYGKYASADNRCLILDGVLLAFARAGQTEYTIPDGVTAIGGGVFAVCTSLTSIHIPDGVITIGNNAFSGCSSLTSINIPNGVTSIGFFAFYNCCSLSVYCKPTTPPTLGDYAFSFDGGSSYNDVPPSLKIYVPAASVEAYRWNWSSKHPEIRNQIFADNN